MVDPTAAALLGVLVSLLEQIYTNVGSWYVVVVLYCIMLCCVILNQGLAQDVDMDRN